ncbi:MAG: ferrochelatase, partial [Anaerolineae bacterium]|nr:ferrochelatase [Anaerolineae bacterium]
MSNKAVLVLAYGTPDSVDGMECYLWDIRGGRPMSREFIEEFQHRYSLIGGKSPLTALTFEQAKNTRLELKRRGHDLPVFVGMRHWSPWIKDVIGQMYVQGIEEAVAIVMAPHYSKMSIGKYWDKINEAQELVGSDIKFSFVDAWYHQSKFIQVVENHVRAGLEKFPAAERDQVKLVFTAHSLPERLLKMGDPYDSQLKESARLVAERLGDVDWMFSYQSAAETGEPWLGPQIEDVVVDLANNGYKHMLAAPIGFVCDHVEILYDIDIESKKIADEHGLNLQRIESMNSDPLFIEAVADAII